MSKLENIRAQLNYAFNNVLPILDEAILKIPPDKLDFKPTEVNMNASQLATHIYQMALLYTLAVEKGDFNAEDLGTIPYSFYNEENPYSPQNAKSAEEIVEYGNKVKEYIRSALDKFTEVDMDKIVSFHFDVKLTGFISMSTILEEAIHHRGQFYIYLRMIGIEPPFVYGKANL